MKNSCCRIILFFGLLTVISLLMAFGAAVHPPSLQDKKDLSQEKVTEFGRPDPEGVPTKVYLGLFIIDVISIDDVNQSYKADFYAILRWNDPRLAIANPTKDQAIRDFDINEIWHPDAYIINKRNLSRDLEDYFRVDSAGNVLYLQRYVGELSSPLDFKDFPFDRQKLSLQVVSFRYGPEDIEFVLDKQRIGRRDQFSLVGWSIGEPHQKITTEYLRVQDRHLARVDFITEVKRERPFYVIKALIPLFLIIFMAWTVFLIDPSTLGPQVGIPTSSVFALFLFNHRISTLLPRVSYLTRIDKFILCSIILVFITLGESVMTATLAQKGKKELALRIDHWARYLYLILFVCVVIYSFVL